MRLTTASVVSTSSSGMSLAVRAMSAHRALCRRMAKPLFICAVMGRAVVCVGGGFGGFWATLAKLLSRALRLRWDKKLKYRSKVEARRLHPSF